MTKLTKATLTLSLLALPAVAQWRIGTAPNCGKYIRVQLIDSTYSCERFAAFPWFAAGAGWKSQFSSFITPVPLLGGLLKGSQFSFGLGPVGLSQASTVFAVLGGPYGGTDYFSFIQRILTSNDSIRIDLLAGATCTGSSQASCTTSPQLAVGPVWYQIDAPDVQTLEASSLQLIYLYADPAFFGANTWQVAVPPVFYDQAKPKWISSFSETSADQKLTLNASNMAFAVANLGSAAQTVKVSLYDLAGNLIAQKETPSLSEGPILNTSATQIVGGFFRLPGAVYAATIKDFFGLTTSMLTPGSAQTAARMGTIDGTIRFEGSGGFNVAPLVVRSAGQSNTVLLATPYD